MKKIKDIFSNISITLKELFRKMPITLIIIIITTLFITITINSKFNSDIIKKAFIFGVTFSVQTFFIETYFKKKYLKIGGYVLSALIAYIFIYLIFNTIYKTETRRILIGYLIPLFLLSVFKILKKSELKFHEYILKIFANIFNSTIVYLILNIGITLLSLVFIELILDGTYGEFLIRTQILMLGLFYVPAILNSISQVKNKEVNSFIKGLVKYVLLPLATIGILIIYVYIVKILILHQMPSNIIFRILAGIFVFAFPVWNMAENFEEENKVIKKATKLLPYLYMPFIILEIYSLGVRIISYGITPVRYFGIVFIILQVIALVLTVIKKKEKLPQIFIYTSIFLVITFIIPIINYDTASKLNQKSILVKYIKEETDFEWLSEKDKAKACGAYNYLYYSNGLKYVPEYIKENKIDEQLKNYYFNYDSIKDPLGKREKTDYIYFNDESNNIYVKDYSNLIEVNQYGTNNISKISLNDIDGNFICNVNLESIINGAIENNNKNMNLATKYLKENKLVKIDETKDLYIRNFSVTYNKETNKIQYLLINGYVLEK